jgi:cell division protein FtsL
MEIYQLSAKREEWMERVQNLTQAYSQAPWRKQMSVIGLFLLVLVFIALVAGIYLNVTARALVIGRDIQSMQWEIQQLEQVNADLQSQLAFITSSASMEQRAKAMGFREIEKDETEFLVVPGYVDRRAAVLAPSPGPVQNTTYEMPLEYTESLFVWLRKQIAQYSFLIPVLKVRS